MWRELRKEKGPSMNLLEMIREIRVDAATSCTQCLIDFTAVLSDELNEKITELSTAMALRGSVRDGETKYADAFNEVMSAVLTLATYTAELNNHRGVAWRDTDAILIFEISPN
jgi:hypothetical protein